MDNQPMLSRRQLLEGLAAGAGALVVGLRLETGHAATDAAPMATEGTPAPWQPNAWIHIAQDGITLLIDRSEMGQGVLTGLAMLLAEELEVDPRAVAVQMAPAERAYDNPALHAQVTGGSSSIRVAFEPLRRAGAQAREVLLQAAAQRLGVAVQTLEARDGQVMHAQSGRALAYAELAAAAARLPLPDADAVRLKEPASFRLIGHDMPRLDSPGIVHGAPIFGIDVQLPGLQVAVVARSPAFGAELRGFDASHAQGMPGVTKVVRIASGVAVIAASYPQALAARSAIRMDWRLPDEVAAEDDASIARRYEALAREDGKVARDEGSARETLARHVALEAQYDLPFAAHVTMEPQNATAHVHDGRVTIWAPTQNQGGTRLVAAHLAGVALEQVTVHTTQLGGGFGRRFELDMIEDAVACAMAVPHPVKVLYSREDDMTHDFYRPAMRHVLRGALDEHGMPVAWWHKVIGPSIAERAMSAMAPAALPDWAPGFVGRMLGRGVGLYFRHATDPSAVEGAADVPYTLPQVHVEYCPDRQARIPLGFWRSVGNSHTAFAVESFIDELAHKAGIDPFQYRRRLLVQAPRHRAVLEAVADLARWDQPPPSGTGRGIVVHRSFETFVAQVAEVHLEGNEIRVDKVYVAVDCGQVVNPGQVTAQMEGAVAFALTATLKGPIHIRQGAVVEQNLNSYPLLRMDEMPEVIVRLLPSHEPPTGAGEPGVPPVAPAVANAIFALTGKRLRRLPLQLTEAA